MYPSLGTGLTPQRLVDDGRPVSRNLSSLQLQDEQSGELYRLSTGAVQVARPGLAGAPSALYDSAPAPPAPARPFIFSRDLGVSAYFEAHNRSKRGIVVDLRHPKGKGVLLTLATGADVFLYNRR